MSRSPHGINYSAYRPVVMGRNGMVASGNALASQAGITVLQRGGNAIDAAVAVAAAVSVVEPGMSGIGGDGYIMVYHREKDEIRVANATGAAPSAATRERYLPDGIPMKGILSVSIPGLLQGWVDAHRHYGMLTLAECFEPAIDLAENGFPVSHVLAANIAADQLLCEFPTSRAVFTRDGRLLAPGEFLYQKNLARTFQRIAEEGERVFYEGEIAREIIRFSDQHGGLLSLDDLKDYRLRWQEPISTTYRDYTVYEAPPNSSGHILLQELNLIEGFNIQSFGANTAESIHVMVEAKKLAFADREAYVADPEFVDVPIQGLLSKDYARHRAALIDPDRAKLEVEAGLPWRYQSSRLATRARNSQPLKESREDTTCFCVVDRFGNAVSQLQSLQSGFGSSLIAGETGILLNNRMTYWHLDNDHVDSLEPGKRVRHTMNPVMVFSETDTTRDLFMVLGTPGADTQVQTNLQLLSHTIDFGMTVAEAAEAPRWRHVQGPTESTYPRTAEDSLRMEDRFTSESVEALKALGHPVELIDSWEAVGSAVLIGVDRKEGTLSGGADPRRDAYAVGW